MVSSRLFWLSLRAVSEWVTLLSSSSKISMIAGHRFSLFCRNLDCQKDDVWSYESVQSNVNNVIDFWCVMSQNNTFILMSYDKNKQWYPANAIWRKEYSSDLCPFHRWRQSRGLFPSSDNCCIPLSGYCLIKFKKMWPYRKRVSDIGIQIELM